MRYRAGMRISGEKTGFTLLELSMVLVIAGLLVGAILAGREIIHASELRALLSDRDRYESATNAFLVKYNCLPGDCPHATRIWGADAACPNTVTNTIKKVATCNGDGSGKITDYPAGGGGDYYECFRYWQQLSNAGLIQGMFTGVEGPGGGTAHVPDVNSPRNAKNGTVLVGWFGKGWENAWDFLSDYNHFFLFQGADDGPLITAADALALDQKADDGRPGYGRIMGPKDSHWSAPNCTTTDDRDTAVYDTTSNALRCFLFMKAAF